MKPACIEQATCLGRKRKGNCQVVRRSQHLIESLRSADETDARRCFDLRLSPNRTYIHVECLGATCKRLTDMTETQNAQGFPTELRPQRGCWPADRPLAFPLAVPQLLIDAAKGPRQRNHRTDDVLGDSHFVSVGVG